MTGNPIRQTKWASWFDPDAWMERMVGPRWEQTLTQEAQHVKQAFQTYQIEPIHSKFRIQMASKQTPVEHPSYEAGGIQIRHMGSFMKQWNWLGDSVIHDARDCFPTTSHNWVTHDIGDGAEKFRLECWSNESRAQPIWTRTPVGPDVACIGNKCIFLGVKNKLVYHEVWCCDADTGDNPKRIYTESSELVNLSLAKDPEGQLLLIRDNSQDISVYRFVSTKGCPVLVHQRTRFSIPAAWILPIGFQYEIEALWKQKGLMILRSMGKRTLWKCSSKASPKILLSIPAGRIEWNPYAAWNGELPLTVHVQTPDKYPAVYVCKKDDSIELTRPVRPTGCQTQRFTTKSYDGSIVAGILTTSIQSSPTKLLMIGYGAYGIPTVSSCVMERWGALLQHGWAIGHAFIRGGGDHTDEWAKAGRREGRIYTIQDFEACIRKAQSILSIPPSHTAIYGRSAGGYLMGAVLNNHPNGDMFRAVYTEVPYVDVLRTTTNPSLPLTKLEYNEFGHPEQRLEDFIQVGVTSPADGATITACPSIFVLTRTADNDSQVYPYESVKWIRRLRTSSGTKGAPKLCVVERNQGHFTPPDVTVEQWSFDCAFLEAWMAKQTPPRA